MMSATYIVDELSYRCYSYNRHIAPETAPERYAPLFPQWREYEARYQAIREWDEVMSDEGGSRYEVTP